ncbi:MAG: tRNA (adenosine(37)-N6)-threonylcarbamoyltransferase complex ATPase subunit type 1 TsaE [Candidatus Magasanikbacteria bacterium RIFCSPHIGHO2_01_FULL_41_23]|uniref:tRNA threonylcarbamoyladenosine biosynthesis protein TsaE n=1 Tax=Candidatus Magasanikbacteria bacterium RIFCSPLOWO2_01_FULL_40_15 TaxID=1798686 RepID=A0A1F6N0E3_9BACT|nr:MAG: tRNA (adenosine(37)-N6)-threonylcarbamoyltransferase complex ATPase subunit type 1 TsaE [Candidatus Magasanikbacteria bacterium RIFCSPHIGHO2_01_FULL_41_23]OGH74639.1 MAG: tRNA (adenosine(37)-N6)-threonylcarbamoyltransferase complex ATPase subunit type 1 TsaE [Candidatus Magasanikbacteria bacterium RIFCSPHIGHO2_12_FULL_41_16]OGH77352.1 MAG: tRNA (adenosine(37)-N6)-threonylcarbamoyltransferase complex ATPase subunit type 1 TsaE [Candidatus Magasanikbacteria bacterium RIFCSPLOWO2_01_FULL_40_
MAKFISKSNTETISIAKKFAGILLGGEVITLSGELGTGKTVFVKGLAQALGVTKEIVSPTFAIMNMLPANKNKIKALVHVDTYRLKNEKELKEIGFGDYLGASDTVCVIEWPELAKGLLPKKIISVTITHGDNQNVRNITIKK